MESTGPSPEIDRPRRGLFRRTFRRFWPRVLLQGLILSTALASMVYVLTDRPDYEATCLIRVNPPRVGLAGMEPYLEFWGLKFSEYLATQVQLVTSPDVFDAAAADPATAKIPGLAGAVDRGAYLRDRVRAGVIPNSYLIRVVARSESAAEAVTIADVVTDAYLRAVQRWSDGMTLTRIKSLQARQKEIEVRKSEKEQRLLALVGEAKSADDEVTRMKIELAKDDLKALRSTAQEVTRGIGQLRFQAAEGPRISRVGMARGAVAPHPYGRWLLIGVIPPVVFAALLALALFRQRVSERSRPAVAASA